jgi:phospholipid transport system substrate-binding protein
MYTIVSRSSSFAKPGGRCDRLERSLRRLCACALGLTAITWFAAAIATTVPPDQLVSQTVHDVQQIIRDDPELASGNGQKTMELVERVILPHFDFQHMTMLAVGRDWSHASPEQQQALVDAFRALLVRTYSGALALYKDYKVDVLPMKAQNSDDASVRTKVSNAGAPPVQMEYRMHRTKEGWKVDDVAVEGVSLVTTYRASFKQEIERVGFDGLIKMINAKGARGRNPGPAPR